MRVLLTKDYAAMSKAAATVMAAQILSKPDSVLGLATGSTPEGMYAELVRRHQEDGLDFSGLRTVNLDEYAGLDGKHEQSYRFFMQKHLFNHVNILPENTFVPETTGTDLKAMCEAYEKNIADLGGVDIQVLGIGHDGHIGFNEPTDYFPDITHAVKLDERTRLANKRFFKSLEEVPTHAYTQGIGTIMRAAKILLLVSGKDKHEILHKALFGPVTPQVPASILQFHPDVLVIADVAAWEE